MPLGIPYCPKGYVQQGCDEVTGRFQSQVFSTQHEQGVLRVRASLPSTALAAGFLTLVCLTTEVMGQAGGAAAPRTAPAAAAPAGTNVAVLDLAFIFTNANSFKADMEAIKGKAEQFEAQMKTRDKDFTVKREDLQALRPGTLEFRQKEEELARVQTEAQLEMRLKQKELVEEEARVFFKMMVEIDKKVATFAQKNRIGLVLRFSRDEMKEENVKQILNRGVIWQSQIDITDFILAELNRGTVTPGAGTGASGVNSAVGRPAGRPAATTPR